MALAPIPWDVSSKTLAEFSEVSLFLLGMVAAPVTFWRGSLTWAVAFWTMAVLIRLIGWARPMWLRPLFLGMILAGWPIGWVVANTLLLIVYLGVFTPIGVLLRWRKGDILGRKPDRAASSYWRDSLPAASPQDYLRQF